MLAGLRILAAILALACAMGCNSNATNTQAAADTRERSASAPAIDSQDKAPPPRQTGGFDGQRAYDYTAKLVSFGPRPPASDAIRRTQSYILGELKGFGCDVGTDDFHASTPIGELAMKNIVAKVPGTGHGIILLLTHYDTLRLPNFVGAEDGGSSTGLMLEMASLLCGNRSQQPNSVWIAFLDGEEAQLVQNGVAQWSSTDSVYGSRELSARLELSGDLKRIRAAILADMIGQKGLKIPKESTSTAWLTDLIWSTAAKLGYQKVFVSQSSPVDDDHDPFLSKHVPAVDIIDLNDYITEGYWHTPQDTMDKISPKSLAIVGHVILTSVGELQKRFSSNATGKP
ncbi:MAG: M28 family peptidase [Candidatus Acidiferrales bacterium]